MEIIRLRQKELEQEAVQLHRRVVYGTTISTLLIFLLVLLYTRQRQKAHLSKLAQTAGEKERQFLALQHVYHESILMAWKVSANEWLRNYMTIFVIIYLRLK